ncbi:MAG: LytTR family transcriptional regulator DNA-binding domain-containing protein [Lachnospiraceae bacterium]|nr:LytTR family transcriptional regulator DNA-binding domain-containing protein [Lachnospiraceae bacterium]
MAEMVDIEVILDDHYLDPKISIYTKSETKQVENIIYAIENTSYHQYPPLPVHRDKSYKVISQRDIYRIRTQGRDVMVDTRDESYLLKGSMSAAEEILDEERFFRISQSEIINLYKVDTFSFDQTGTVGVVFDNAVTSWASRRCVKPLRDKLAKRFGRI